MHARAFFGVFFWRFKGNFLPHPPRAVPLLPSEKAIPHPPRAVPLLPSEKAVKNAPLEKGARIFYYSSLSRYTPSSSK